MTKDNKPARPESHSPITRRRALFGVTALGGTAFLGSDHILAYMDDLREDDEELDHDFGVDEDRFEDRFEPEEPDDDELIELTAEPVNRHPIDLTFGSDRPMEFAEEDWGHVEDREIFTGEDTSNYPDTVAAGVTVELQRHDVPQNPLDVENTVTVFDTEDDAEQYYEQITDEVTSSPSEILEDHEDTFRGYVNAAYAFVYEDDPDRTHAIFRSQNVVSEMNLLIVPVSNPEGDNYEPMGEPGMANYMGEELYNYWLSNYDEVKEPHPARRAKRVEGDDYDYPHPPEHYEEKEKEEAGNETETGD